MHANTITLASVEALAAELDASLERIRQLLAKIDSGSVTPKDAAITVNNTVANINHHAR